jgi:hypothetical protein
MDIVAAAAFNGIGSRGPVERKDNKTVRDFSAGIFSQIFIQIGPVADTDRVVVAQIGSYISVLVVGSVHEKAASSGRRNVAQ